MKKITVPNISDYTMYEVIDNLGDYVDDLSLGDRLINRKRVALVFEYCDRDLIIECKNLKHKDGMQ